jgi:4-alpha-glucanotransferase
MHPTSLPGRYGIGDLGDACFRFVDFLVAARQTYWQVLPMSPTGYADSPYQGLSVFAGNPMLISPDRLRLLGHLTDADLANPPPFPSGRVDFGWIIPYKRALLDHAYDRFKSNGTRSQRESFAEFCRRNALWLEDLSLFMALKEHYDLKAWYEWAPDIAARQPEAVAEWRGRLAGRIESQKYRQWQFYEQWLEVKQYANQQGIRIIGDIPLYVAGDSADVWANPQLFFLDKNLNPTVVSGVPPDYFSATGQLWGHPIYRWDLMARQNYAWWIERFRIAFTQADVVRIDHFRGFYNYWEVPASEKTAIKGRWLFGPGPQIFRTVTQQLGEVAIIAEDLGDFDTASRAGLDAIQEEFGYPGMKVLQFAFGSTAEDLFLPHNFARRCVVYTGTHDNDTTVGWYKAAAEKERDYVRRYVGRSGSDIAWDLMRLAWASVADTALTTVQDVLSLGTEARLNSPGTSGAHNWTWRLPDGALNEHIAARLADLTVVYGRVAPAPIEPDVLAP